MNEWVRDVLLDIRRYSRATLPMSQPKQSRVRDVPTVFKEANIT
jgi:hypothetical protein